MKIKTVLAIHGFAIFTISVAFLIHVFTGDHA